MCSLTPSLEVGLGLGAWTVLSVAFARLTERRACGTQPPAPWVAVTLALPLAALALLTQPTPLAAAAAGIACISLVAAACVDARTGFLFDALTLPAALAVTLLAIVAGSAREAAAGGVLLAGSFGAVVAYSRGRWMGLGDVKAMYVIGAAFGPAESLVAVFAACCSGIATAAWQGRCRRGYRLRFGPHLAAGAAFTLAFGAPLVHDVLGL